MLLNLSQALRELGRPSEANAVARRALELAPDHSSSWHRTWLAADHFLAGDLQAARAELERARPDERPPYAAHLFRMLELTLELLACPDPRRAFPAIRRAVAAQVRGYPGYRHHRPLRELHAACIASIARRRGGLAGLVWRLRRRWR
jgi:Flp pilus assembly protein TadD